MRTEAWARGITLLVNRAKYSRQELERAVAFIWGGRERLGQLGFGLQGIRGPTRAFFGLTVFGFVLGDEKAAQLSPDLVALARGELSGLLQDSQVRLDDVRIEYGRVFPAAAACG